MDDMIGLAIRAEIKRNKKKKLMGGEESAEKFEYCFVSLNCSLFSLKNRENCFQENTKDIRRNK